MAGERQAIVIKEKIVGWGVVKPEEEKKEEVKEGVAPATPMPLFFERPEGEIDGTTYKIRVPHHDEAIYITVNNVEIEGQKRPIEIFIHTKNPEGFQWITAMTRLISMMFRQPTINLQYMIEELKGVCDVNGSYRIKGTVYSSIVAHIGKIIEKHCKKIGFSVGVVLSEEQKVYIDEKRKEADARGVKKLKCSKCQEVDVVRMDGCLTCLSCGDSKCG